MVEKLGYERVTIGDPLALRGSKNFIATNTNFNNAAKDGFIYDFGCRKSEVFVTTVLTQIRQEIAALIGAPYQLHITSIRQVTVVKEFIPSLNEDDKAKLLNNYIDFTNCYVTTEWNVEHLRFLFNQFLVLGAQNSVLFNKLFDSQHLWEDDSDRDTNSPYKYGVTIDKIYKLPVEVVDTLLNNKEVRHTLKRGSFVR